MPESQQQRIGRRLQALREKRELSQEEVAPQLGFNNRQTLSAIENGTRQIQAGELVAASRFYDVELTYFTDAFRLDGEGEFSFRVADPEPAALDQFEHLAGGLIAAYRELSDEGEGTQQVLASQLRLSERSSFEDAAAAGERLVRDWGLGAVPALKLLPAIREQLGTLVLFVDAPAGISGAAFRLPEFDTILVNRNETQGRRNFDLAHELFHLLTWERMPPARLDSPTLNYSGGSNRAERLAEHFAGGLLMPEAEVRRFWDRRGNMELVEWLNTTATAFRATSQALSWRIVNLGLISATKAKQIPQGDLANNGGAASAEPRPRLFSAELVERIYTGVERGRLSVRRASRLLRMSPHEFASLCEEHELTLSFEVSPPEDR